MTGDKIARVLFVLSTLKRTGPTGQLFNLVKYLDRTRYHPFILTLSDDPPENRWAEFADLGVRLDSLELSRAAGFVLARHRLRKHISSIRPSIIHSQGIRADVLASMLPANIPRVATIRNFPQVDYRMNYGRVLSAFMVARHRRAMNSLTCCVGVSEAVTANLRGPLGIARTTTIVNGVDTSVYCPADIEEKRVTRSRLGLPLEAQIWISTGHLTELKNPLGLIEGFSLHPDGPGNRLLLLVGGGSLEKACREASASKVDVRVVGRVPNVAEYLRASDYFVSASTTEGLPNSVIEAMACGLPVLLSDIGPHREIFEGDERIGLLFRTGSMQDLARTMGQLSARDYVAGRQAVLEAAGDRFSASRMARLYQSLYDELRERLVFRAC